MEAQHAIIKRLEIKGLWGKQDFTFDFHDDLNIFLSLTRFWLNVLIMSSSCSVEKHYKYCLCEGFSHLIGGELLCEGGYFERFEEIEGL
jgi:hypothetical protein